MSQVRFEQKIELGPDDAALVVRGANMEMQMYLPNAGDPESPTPRSFLLVSVLAFLLTNPRRNVRRLMRKVMAEFNAAQAEANRARS